MSPLFFILCIVLFHCVPPCPAFIIAQVEVCTCLTSHSFDLASMAQNQRPAREGNDPFQDFLGLRSQPALRIAFSVMACYRLYVSEWVRQLIEVFFSLQCVLLTALWVLIHLLYLSFPSVCLNQSQHLPLLSNLSRLDVLRVTLWINYTIPAMHHPG